jgi:hypothetical protein
MAFYEKQKRKQVTSGYKIKMSGLHHGLLVKKTFLKMVQELSAIAEVSTFGKQLTQQSVSIFRLERGLRSNTGV